MARNTDESDGSVPFQPPDDFPAESGGILGVEIAKNLERNANLQVAPRTPVVPPERRAVEGKSSNPNAEDSTTSPDFERGFGKMRNSRGKPLTADRSMTLLIGRTNRHAKNIHVKKFLRNDEAHYRVYGSHKQDKKFRNYTGHWEALQEEMWQKKILAHVRERQQRAYEALPKY
ncbi:hypothetical protein C8R46DRAFT_1040899 [Mycena filopes]|nr:hypothetical protein C8R46DRAFT_1040899 [Mycena filopes]